MSLLSDLNLANPHLHPPPPAATALGHTRVLSPKAGIRVSPLCLGGMSIGDAWEGAGMGSMNKESSFKLLDAFYDAGGNFIDTASAYQDETSEQFIGEWMEARGIRDQMVIATKYTTEYKKHDDSIKQKIQYVGNSTKVMRISLEASLKKLRTSYIDIFYVHWWDWSTSIEEIMNSLHNLVVAGKVLYLGVSDTPAWIVSKANQYARDHGKTPFVIYQGQWSVLLRDFEREIIPMAYSEGMALAPWDVLCRGKIRTDAEEEQRRKTGENGRTFVYNAWERNENERKMSAALEKVAAEIGAKSIQAVAIAYVMQKTPYVFPIVGGRKVEHLHANIEALSISLSKEHIAYIESIVPFDLGFPGNGNGQESEDLFMVRLGGETRRWPRQEPIRSVKA
ncbi:Aldo/keto reductase [Vararia minispora EC-137]|uniref:Aldo/keto reductase n=1 Tax=Vararia minispora EC-137 TaxID=1314806 RepID=A0ACB8QNG6_9AGAM|nr:Aldo/keto reductase [Vararia minispora EC-137]